MDIFGDGLTLRDFCYIKDVVRANILAALCDNGSALNQVYNIGSARARTRAVSLNDLFLSLKNVAKDLNLLKGEWSVNYKDFRKGDIHFSLASIDKAQKLLGFSPFGVGRIKTEFV